MAKVLVSLGDERVRDTVIAALAGTRHEAVVMETLDPAEGLATLAEKIMADMKAANATTLDQYKAMPGAVSDSVNMVTFAAPAYVSALRSSEPLVGAYASVAEVNKLSAPIEGNAGVFVLQMYSKDKLNETFNEKDEETTLTGMHVRFASRLMNDLYLKGKVKDTRYLFF